MNALSHMLDYRRSQTLCTDNIPVFIAAEIYLDRVKKCLSKQMKVEWNVVLSIEYLNSINCWAGLSDLQAVIPYHADKFTQILLNAGNVDTQIPAHDLSFATAFITAVLFIMVKASRPMTFQYLTVRMVLSISIEGRIIDQTKFKTNCKYGFDSLIFSTECITILKGYISCIRPRLNPTCEYLLVSRNGIQLRQLSHIFGRIVFLAIGKYINPTRYRQIIETESVSNLDSNDQNILSQNQKHTSRVAKVHYQKMQSRVIAEKGQRCMKKLVSIQENERLLKDMAAQIITEQGSSSKKDLSPVLFTVNDSRKELTEEVVTEGRTRKVPFSRMEDTFLCKGIKKYGAGKWTSILNEPEYKFHPSRKASTLLLRARKISFTD